MANKLVPVLCARFKPHQSGVRGPITGKVYHFKKKGRGLALALVDEKDVKGILENPDYKLASLTQLRIWRS